MFCMNILLFSIFSFVYAQQLTKNADSYGPFEVEYLSYAACKGPKAHNVTTMTTILTDSNMGVLNFTFFDDTKIDEVKIYVYSLKDNKRTFLWSYKLNDPCKHFSVSLIIEKFLKADNCVIAKGFYNMELSFKEMTNSILGTSFFYGQYFMKAVIISKKGNIGCLGTALIIRKKTLNEN